MVNRMDAKNEIFYNELWKQGDWSGPHLNRDEQVRLSAIIHSVKNINFLLEKNQIKIADIGCGRGWLSKELSQYGNVVGIDPTESSIEKAKLHFPDINYYCMNSEDLLNKFGSESFHLVCSSEVIEHIPNIDKKNFLDNIFGLLKNGGYLILTTPRGELFADWIKIDHKPQPVEDWMTSSKLKSLCIDAGFEHISHERIYLPGFTFNYSSEIINNKKFRHIFSKFLGHKLLDYISKKFGIYQIITMRKN